MFPASPTPIQLNVLFIYNAFGGATEEKQGCCWSRYPAISSDAEIQLLTRTMLSVHYTVTKS